MSLDAELASVEQRQLAEVFSRAFAGFPWYRDLPVDELEERVASHAALPGYGRLVELGEDTRIKAAIWYDTPSLDELEAERGVQLREFAASTLLKHQLSTVVWEREVLVDPSTQGQGLGTKLRQNMLESLSQKFPSGALLLTRMRDDNTPIIRIAEKLDYQRTGVRMPSGTGQQAFHEFWYRLIGASNENDR